MERTPPRRINEGESMAESSVLTRIEEVLEEIRPALHSDGGDIELIDFDEEGFVHVNMLGACGGCPMSTATLVLGVEAALRERVPEVEGVIPI